LFNVDQHLPRRNSGRQTGALFVLRLRRRFGSTVVGSDVDTLAKIHSLSLSVCQRNLTQQRQPGGPELYPSADAAVALKDILNTGRFDMKAATESPGWLQSLKDPNSHIMSEADEYGVSSFVSRSRKPFHPKKIAQWEDRILHFSNVWKDLPADIRQQQSEDKHTTMVQEYGATLRAKGFCWIAGRDTFMIGFAQSGRIGGWSRYAVVRAYSERSTGRRRSIRFSGRWRKVWLASRWIRKEIVFIGMDLKVGTIRAALDACLFTKNVLVLYKFYMNDGYQ
jgi:G3E family GTPase